MDIIGNEVWQQHETELWNVGLGFGISRELGREVMVFGVGCIVLGGHGRFLLCPLLLIDGA